MPCKKEFSLEEGNYASISLVKFFNSIVNDGNIILQNALSKSTPSSENSG